MSKATPLWGTASFIGDIPVFGKGRLLALTRGLLGELSQGFYVL